MGIALLGLTSLFLPLRDAAHRWRPARRGRALARRFKALRPDGCAHDALPAGAEAARPPRPLRVVRLVDAQDRRGASGRIVLSGRLEDVCVELERLAALEGAEPRAAAKTPIQ